MDHTVLDHREGGFDCVVDPFGNCMGIGEGLSGLSSYLYIDVAARAELSGS